MKGAQRRGSRVKVRAARPRGVPGRRTVPLLLHTRFVRFRLPNGELEPFQQGAGTEIPLDVSAYLPIHLPTLRGPAGFTVTTSDDRGATWEGPGRMGTTAHRKRGRGRRGNRGL